MLNEEFCINVSDASICRVLKEAGFRKVCASWVPPLLTDENRLKRLETALSFLQL